MNYQKIYTYDFANGPGVRVSLFVSGCSIHCPGCFNKQAWDFCSGKKFTWRQMRGIKKLLKSDKIDGLSLLGGEPFDQDKKGLKKLIKLCKYAHKYNKDVWAWTGHYLVEFANDKDKYELAKNCDVIVEGPFEEEHKDYNLAWRGSRNQRLMFLM